MAHSGCAAAIAGTSWLAQVVSGRRRAHFMCVNAQTPLVSCADSVDRNSSLRSIRSMVERRTRVVSATAHLADGPASAS